MATSDALLVGIVLLGLSMAFLMAILGVLIYGLGRR